jgi:hypothetical protein
MRVVEHTLGTFSWLQSNARPSFMLMTLRGEGGGGAGVGCGGGGGGCGGVLDEVAGEDADDADSSAAVATSLCYLPRQIWTVRAYTYLGILTAVTLLLLPLVRILSVVLRSLNGGGRGGGGWRDAQSLARLLLGGGGKYKVEDDEDEDENADDGAARASPGGFRSGDSTGGGGGGSVGKLFYAANANRGVVCTPQLLWSPSFFWKVLGLALWRHCGPFVVCVVVCVGLWSAMVFADLAAR